MLDRHFFHYEDLEEWRDGMWKIVRGKKRADYINASADLMRCPDEFKTAMMSALEEWPNSSRHNLSAESINRIAWLGHAGCCVCCGSPEDCTRAGWHMLTKDEQDAANRVAEEVLNVWVSRNQWRGTLFGWSMGLC
jgi:hypothetical protein